ncbi:GFA family protein [Teredinibacter sp. KSP-S5-2]|uniref:GFA family protein n=1 Tax=Teredinibacter sp. KSP-S5-2 TaxID=3034506 RepID=UPI0029344CB5|nr:GFA family protein [Teredinibacter sp. KSP-S5-2]WNO09932.1 GFA family protein [Teredinibacter sp. KSP-S5-2]
MIEGSCLCGAIKYQVELIPGKIFNCHCQFCRKAHGADYVTVALAKAKTLVISDDNNYLKEHLNNIGGYRAFCGNCGTRLMNYAPNKSIYLSVTLSTIDTPINLKPVAHVNTESKACWNEPYEGIPSFSQLPDGIV